MALKVKLFPVLLVLFWLALIGPGEYLLLNYEKTPAQTAQPPQTWPADTSIVKNSGPFLLMFIHPHCPCTRATMEELSLLMAHCHKKLEGQVLFLKPAGFDRSWSESGLWKKASSIPGIKAILDEGGREAKRFGAMASGQVLLFDASGRLVFKGGITRSRGHSGDNPGRSAIESLVLKGAAPLKETPVFGCALKNEKISFVKEILNLWKNQPKICPLPQK